MASGDGPDARVPAAFAARGFDARLGAALEATSGTGGGACGWRVEGEAFEAVEERIFFMVRLSASCVPVA
jgi:hypothetical protein